MTCLQSCTIITWETSRQNTSGGRWPDVDRHRATVPPESCICSCRSWGQRGLQLTSLPVCFSLDWAGSRNASDTRKAGARRPGRGSTVGRRPRATAQRWPGAGPLILVRADTAMTAAAYITGVMHCWPLQHVSRAAEPPGAWKNKSRLIRYKRAAGQNQNRAPIGKLCCRPAPLPRRSPAPLPLATCPSKHEASSQHWFTVSPASTTLAQQ